MRVINNDQKWLARINALEAARHGGKLSDSRSDNFPGEIERHAGANGGENIVNIDSPHEG